MGDLEMENLTMENLPMKLQALIATGFSELKLELFRNSLKAAEREIFDEVLLHAKEKSYPRSPIKFSTYCN